ncbi:MAG: YbgC/FadM family acyl-CoA thioesterase [Rickettsiales bacterium]|jgi:acyl-CoA thioester hydrolase|nr:YbgC/FadM family acyl-CoA thioesterase [Rickettsiales bacterium]
MTQEFYHKVRVYYEDTDLASVVYYANYLKFAERARTEMLRSLGINQNKIAKEQNIFFVVKECKINYMASSRLDDELEILTKVVKVNSASILLQQKIFLQDKLITNIDVLIVSVNDKSRIVKVPSDIRKRLVS